MRQQSAGMSNVLTKQSLCYTTAVTFRCKILFTVKMHTLNNLVAELITRPQKKSTAHEAQFLKLIFMKNLQNNILACPEAFTKFIKIPLE
jgi:hypothetical protein